MLPLIKIFLMTGKRVGELLGLTHDKIDHENKTIRIEQMVSGGRFYNRLKMHADSEVLTMDEELSSIIKDLQRMNQKFKPGSDWLFPAWPRGVKKNFPKDQACPYDGKPIKTSSVRKFVTMRMKRAGVPVKKVHDLRKTFATIKLMQLLRDGEPMAREIIRKSLNHKDMKTTEKYISIPDEYLRGGSSKNVLAGCYEGVKQKDMQSEATLDDLILSHGLDPKEVDFNLLIELIKTMSKNSKKAA